MRPMMNQMKSKIGVAVAIFLLGGIACAALPPTYEQTFFELSALIDGETPRPAEMLRGSWQAVSYFMVARKGLGFNRVHFLEARTPGEAGLSGIFLGVHGAPAHHQILCNTLETDRRKRSWMAFFFGTEEAFKRTLQEGETLRPLVSILPSTTGVRSLLKRLRGSRDGLVRRAGIFCGYWLADADYWHSVRDIAEQDADPVNRACAAQLLARI